MIWATKRCSWYQRLVLFLFIFSRIVSASALTLSIWSWCESAQRQRALLGVKFIKRINQSNTPSRVKATVEFVYGKHWTTCDARLCSRSILLIIKFSLLSAAERRYESQKSQTKSAEYWSSSRCGITEITTRGTNFLVTHIQNVVVYTYTTLTPQSGHKWAPSVPVSTDH